MANLINWLEIPVTDMDRAKKFYEVVLQAEIKIDEETSPGLKMGMIFTENMDMKDVGGALVEGKGYTPGSNNTLIYLNANETGGCNAFLKRVEDNGGQVTNPAFEISPEIGYCGFFIDSEGNTMAVHSSKN
jgi:uncharacterized protein